MRPRAPRLPIRLAVATACALLAASPVSAAPSANQWAAVPSIYGDPISAGLIWSVKTGPDGRLYMYGSFANAGGDPTADNLAVYDPVTHDWSGIGSNGQGDGALNDWVFDIAWVGTKLVVVGSFDDAGGVANADAFAVWNGTSWSTRSANGVSPFPTGQVNSVDVLNGVIYVAGSFANADTVATADAVAKWDGLAWSGLVAPGALDGVLPGTATKVDALPDGRVFVSGSFTSAAGDVAAARLAYFDTATTTWHHIGGPAVTSAAISAGSVLDFEVVGSRIYIAGLIADVGGNAAADWVAMWTGSTWTNMGTNAANAASGSGPLNTFAIGLAMYGTTVIVTGQFTDAGGNANGDCVAAWNGATWVSLANPAATSVSGPATCVSGQVVGRTFTMAGSFTSIAGKAGTHGLAQFGLPLGPSAPSGLAGTPGSMRVSLSWQAPATTNGSPITDYVVQYRKAGTATWRTFSDGVKTTRTAVVTGLVTGSAYEFRVAARNGWTTGGFSSVIRKTAG